MHWLFLLRTVPYYHFPHSHTLHQHGRVPVRAARVSSLLAAGAVAVGRLARGGLCAHNRGRECVAREGRGRHRVPYPFQHRPERFDFRPPPPSLSEEEE